MFSSRKMPRHRRRRRRGRRRVDADCRSVSCRVRMLHGERPLHRTRRHRTRMPVAGGIVHRRRLPRRYFGFVQWKRQYHHADGQYADHLRVDLHVRLDDHRSRQRQSGSPSRQECGSVHHTAGRVDPGSANDCWWHRQTCRGARFGPGERNVFHRERRDIGIRRFGVRGMTPRGRNTRPPGAVPARHAHVRRCAASSGVSTNCPGVSRLGWRNDPAVRRHSSAG